MATRDHCIHCFDVLHAHFTRTDVPRTPFELDLEFPLFVTWNKCDAQGRIDLRGCIGAAHLPPFLLPHKRLTNARSTCAAGCLKPLPLSSLKEYALTSAFKDRRFAPIAESELPFLQCMLLHFYENWPEGM